MIDALARTFDFIACFQSNAEQHAQHKPFVWARCDDAVKAIGVLHLESKGWVGWFVRRKGRLLNHAIQARVEM